MLEKITDIIKNTVKLNLQYSSTMLYLSKDYLKDINAIIGSSQAPGQPPGAPSDVEPATRPAPLLIVGEADETASAAFPLNNTSGKDANVHLLVQGELSEKHLKIEPSVLVLKPGESAIVRVLARIDETLEVDRNYVGAVVAPGFSAQSVQFIVRRLPGTERSPEDAAGSKPSRASARKRA